jgi:site-specific recombinase XerD
MGKLVDEYNKNLRIYLRKKSNVLKKSENDRKNKIINFLKFCESQNVKSIKDITNDNYRSFVNTVLASKSTETKRKYLLSLREFFARAHLNIVINTKNNISRTKEKKLSKILNILNINDNDINQQQKNAILSLL